MEIAVGGSEMKRYVIPYDHPDMDSSLMHIDLRKWGPDLLAGMSKDSSKKAYEFLTSMGVDVQFGKMVTDYKDHKVLMKRWSGDSYPYLPLGIRCKGTAYHGYRWRPSGPWFPNRSR